MKRAGHPISETQYRILEAAGEIFADWDSGTQR